MSRDLHRNSARHQRRDLEESNIRIECRHQVDVHAVHDDQCQRKSGIDGLGSSRCRETMTSGNDQPFDRGEHVVCREFHWALSCSVEHVAAGKKAGAMVRIIMHQPDVHGARRVVMWRERVGQRRQECTVQEDRDDDVA